MRKIKYYLSAMRLRTLPLSLSGAVLGCMLACADYHPGSGVVAMVLLTTVLLQILSNVSNELGDMLSGTDSPQRQGPAYVLSQGKLSVNDFRRMVWIYAFLCALSGLGMIYCSFGTLFCLEALIMVLIGAAAIQSAIKYTLGKKPYGYRGLGDLSVFIFFGLVSVIGSYFMVSHDLGSWKILLPAVSVGCFSVGVLNVNNIRDMESDRQTRVTTPIRIGEKNAKIYQTVLILLGWTMMLLYSYLRIYDPWHYLYLLTLPFFVLHLSGLWKRSGKALDPMLPLLVVSTFCFCLLAGFGFVLFLFCQ